MLNVIKALAKDDRAVVGEDLRAVQHGFPIGMPICRALGKGLFEVRSSLPSKVEARLIFFQDATDLVVVEGFIKKSRATPAEVIALSNRRRAQYLAARKP